MKIVVNKELAAEIKNTLEKSKIVYVPASANHHAYQYASNRTKKQTLQPSKTAIRIQYANKSPLVATTIQPLKITRNDWKKIAISETQKLNNELQTNKHICKAVGKRVSSANIRHSYYSKLSGKVRNFNEAKNHTPYIPFALSVIENGIEDKELSENGFHEIIGRADIIDKGKNVRIGIAVILVEIGRAHV